MINQPTKEHSMKRHLAIAATILMGAAGTLFLSTDRAEGAPSPSLQVSGSHTCQDGDSIYRVKVRNRTDRLKLVWFQAWVPGTPIAEGQYQSKFLREGQAKTLTVRVDQEMKFRLRTHSRRTEVSYGRYYKEITVGKVILQDLC